MLSSQHPAVDLKKILRQCQLRQSLEIFVQSRFSLKNDPIWEVFVLNYDAFELTEFRSSLNAFFVAVLDVLSPENIVSLTHDHVIKTTRESVGLEEDYKDPCERSEQLASFFGAINLVESVNEP